MNFKKPGKLFTYLFLISYVFFAAGINVYAKCLYSISSSCGKIECCCCHSRTNHYNSNFYAPVLNSDEGQCPCSIKTTVPSKPVIQLSQNSSDPLNELLKIVADTNNFSCLISFNDADYYKIRPKPKITLNKTLESLKTVILLN